MPVIEENKLIEYHSPCTNVCTIKDNICIGCGRTLDEITDWTSMTNEQRREIYERVSHSIQHKEGTVLSSK